MFVHRLLCNTHYLFLLQSDLLRAESIRSRSAAPSSNADNADALARIAKAVDSIGSSSLPSSSSSSSSSSLPSGVKYELYLGVGNHAGEGETIKELESRIAALEVLVGGGLLQQTESNSKVQSAVFLLLALWLFVLTASLLSSPFTCVPSALFSLGRYRSHGESCFIGTEITASVKCNGRQCCKDNLVYYEPP